MPPALGIVAVALACGLFGALGLVVAAPLAVAGMVGVKMLYVEDVPGPALLRLHREAPGTLRHHEAVAAGRLDRGRLPAGPGERQLRRPAPGVRPDHPRGQVERPAPDRVVHVL